MPPHTPSRRRTEVAEGGWAPGSSFLSAIPVRDLARGDFLERDRQVVLGGGVDHRRRELLEGALAEVVVVAVDLTRALGGDDHAGVRRVDVFQQTVYAGRNHVAESRALLTTRSNSSAASSSRSLWTTCANSSWAASSALATSSRCSTCSGSSCPRP